MSAALYLLFQKELPSDFSAEIAARGTEIPVASSRQSAYARVID